MPPFDVAPFLVTPYKTVDEVRRAIQLLEEGLRHEGDLRAVFLTAYIHITEAVDGRMREGRFADPEWVGRILVAFANRYRIALAAHIAGGALPTPWRIAFDTAARGEGLAIQHLLLGMNAHINYDLALAVVDVTPPAEIPGRRTDFACVEATLAATVDAIQDEIAASYAPGLSVLDLAFGRIDEIVADWGMRYIRTRAWRAALALVASKDAEEGGRRLAELDAEVTAIAHAILSPTSGRPRTLAALRALEKLHLGARLVRLAWPGRRPTTTVRRGARTLRITLRRHVDVTPEVLWPYLVIPERMNEWSLATVMPVSPGPGGAHDEAGARRRVRVNAPFGEFFLDEVILESEHPRRLVYRVTKGLAVKSHRGEMSVRVRGDGRSELRWHVEIDFVFPGAPIFAERILVPQLEQSLDALGRAARGAK